jgi:hypothetical protein
MVAATAIILFIGLLRGWFVDWFVVFKLAWSGGGEVRGGLGGPVVGVIELHNGFKTYKLILNNSYQKSRSHLSLRRSKTSFIKSS